MNVVELGRKALRVGEGVPSVVQQVKNLTAAAGVTVEAWVGSPAQSSVLKDTALPKLGLDSIPGQELAYAVGAAIKKRKKMVGEIIRGISWVEQVP